MKCQVNYYNVDKWPDTDKEELKESFRCTEDFSHPVSREALVRYGIYVCSICAVEYTFKKEACDNCKTIFDNEFVRVKERTISIKLGGYLQEHKLYTMKEDTDNIPKAKITLNGITVNTLDIESYALIDVYCNQCPEIEPQWDDEDWADYYGMDVEEYRYDGGERAGH